MYVIMLKKIYQLGKSLRYENMNFAFRNLPVFNLSTPSEYTYLPIQDTLLGEPAQKTPD